MGHGGQGAFPLLKLFNLSPCLEAQSYFLNQCSSRRGLVGDPFTCFRGILPHHMGRIGMKSGQSFLLLMLLIKAPTFSSGLIVKPAFEAGGGGWGGGSSYRTLSPCEHVRALAPAAAAL